MKCKITATANSGVIVNLGSDVILIDALHNTHCGKWTALTDEMVDDVFSLLEKDDPDAAIYTHMHSDHYSEGLTKRLLTEFPETRLIMPSDKRRPEEGEYYGNGFSVRWFPLPHLPTGENPPVLNFGFEIRSGSCSVFTAGDADPSSEELKNRISGLCPDLALLNFPWMTLRTGREALSLLNPKKVALIHLPYVSDDTLGYNKATADAVSRFCPDAVILNSFLQKAEFNF